MSHQNPSFIHLASTTGHSTANAVSAPLDVDALAEASISITTSASYCISAETSLSYQPKRITLNQHQAVVASSAPNRNMNGNDDSSNSNNNGDDDDDDHHHTLSTAETDGNSQLISTTTAATHQIKSHISKSAKPPSSHNNNTTQQNQQFPQQYITLPLDGSLVENPIKFLNCSPEWELTKRIGAGGFGDVWLGYRKSDPEKCLRAIKIAKASQGTMKELDHEIELLILMPSHPHIVQPLHYSTFAGGTQLVMEYCKGGSLQGWLEKHGAMSEDRVREYTRQILVGLAFLHRTGVLHLDLKPPNILLADEQGWLVKLADFGLSSTLHKLDGTTIGGSARFMSHECFTSPAQVTGAADLWALGATIVQLLTNKRPWSDKVPDDRADFWRLRSLIISLPLDENERALHHPTIPDFVSDECKSFLRQVFSIDPFKRGTAQQLLSHPWIMAEVLRRHRLQQEIRQHQQQHQQLQQQHQSQGESSALRFDSTNSATTGTNTAMTTQVIHHSAATLLSPFSHSVVGPEQAQMAREFENAASSHLAQHNHYRHHNLAGTHHSSSNLETHVNQIGNTHDAQHAANSNAAISSEESNGNNSNSSDNKNSSNSNNNYGSRGNFVNNPRLPNSSMGLSSSSSSCSLSSSSISAQFAATSVALPSDALNTQLLAAAVQHVEDRPDDPRLWSCVGRLLPSEETIQILGRPYSRTQCLLKSCQLDPDRVLWWNMLGRELNFPSWYFLGPTTVARRERSPGATPDIDVDATYCFVKCLEISPNVPVGWRNLGLALKPNETAKVAGIEYNKQQCYLRAVNLDPAQGPSWTNLGVTLKMGESVLVNGQSYSKLECFIKAVTLDPSSAAAWGNVGNLLRTSETVAVGDQQLTKLQCQINAVTFNPGAPQSWNNLAAAMNQGSPTTTATTAAAAAATFASTSTTSPAAGSSSQQPMTVTVAGRQVTRLQCLLTALALDPHNAARWRTLGFNMGKEGVDSIKFDFSAKAGTIEVTRKDCYEKAVCLEPDTAIRWSELGAIMGDDDVVYVRPIIHGNSTSSNNINSSSSSSSSSRQNVNGIGATSSSSCSSSSEVHKNRNSSADGADDDVASPSCNSSAATEGGLAATTTAAEPRPCSPDASQLSQLSPPSASSLQQEQVFESNRNRDFPPMTRVQCLTRASSLDNNDATSLHVLSNLLKPGETVLINDGEERPQDSNDLKKRVLELCSVFYDKVDEHCHAIVTDHNRLYSCEKGHIMLPHRSKTWRCDYCRGRDDVTGSLSCRTCDIDICCECFDTFLKSGTVGMIPQETSMGPFFSTSTTKY